MTPADESLESAARDCLGRLFGVFPSPSAPTASGDTWDRAVIVGFRGEKNGHLRLDFFGGAHGALTRHWVGGGVDESDGNDVAGEFANILCCHVLPSLFSPRALFQVESPRGVADERPAEKAVMAFAPILIPGGRIEARVIADPA